MLKQAEQWSFPQRSFDLLDAVRKSIEPDDASLGDWYSNYCREHRARFAADLSLVEQQVPPEARILEYGAVPLLTTAALVELGYQTSALDIAPERFGHAIASLGLDVRKCDIETEPAPFDSDAFDAVVFNELFEHLRIDPIFTLSEVHRVLKRDGVLLLSTPNLRSLRGIRNLLIHNEGHAASAGIYRQYEKLKQLGHMGHVREYTTKEVSEFLTRIGFRVDRVVYRGGHGKGAVGVIERLAPSLRPFFSLIAAKSGSGGE